jgi:hypothetical protein
MNYFSLENTIKEILLSIFLSENCWYKYLE